MPRPHSGAHPTVGFRGNSRDWAGTALALMLIEVTDAEQTAMTPDVLVVEDEAPIRQITSRWLQHAGYRVAGVASAEEAIAVADGRGPQVLVTDVQMPGRDGLWLAQQFRHRFPDTALVMVSGDPTTGPAAATARLGAFDYLPKPFTADQLTEAVDRGVRWHEARVIERLDRAATELCAAHGLTLGPDALDRMSADVFGR